MRIKGRGSNDAPLSILLALSLVTVVSLSSFAVSAKGEKPAAVKASASPQSAQTLTGTLVGRGQITINGNEAKVGATILSGNTIATGSNGHATIELMTLGRIDLQPYTAITLTFSPGLVQTTLDHCGSITQTLPGGVTGVVTVSDSRRTHVSVKVGGPVKVRYHGGEATLQAGDSKTFDSAIEVTAQGGSVFRVYCGNDKPLPAGFWLAPGAGLLGLLGGAAIHCKPLTDQTVRPQVSTTAP